MLTLAGLLAVSVFPSGAPPQDFPDVPENHWVYEDLAHFKKIGIVPEMPGLLLRGAFAWTRTDIAGFTIHAAMNFGAKVDHANDSFLPFYEQQFGQMTPRARLDFALNLERAGKDFHRLISEFKSEMPKFVNPKQLDQYVSDQGATLEATVEVWSRP